MSNLARPDGPGSCLTAEPQSVSGHSPCDPSRTPWQPIATAPRDGTLVAIRGNYFEGGTWESEGWYETAPADRCWYDYDGEEPCRPTHWRPLDQPSAAARTGAGE